jgi:ribosomal protein S18 acetylase RimI-like enzyme
VRDDDRDFLYRVYAGTRLEELELATDWSAEQKEQFLRQQFAAQDAYYRENYPGAEWSVVLRHGEPAGRLYIHRRPAEIRLMEIALLPEHRGGGLGTALLEELMAEARATGRPLTIHVEVYNPALRLYERLGFRKQEDKGVYWLMEWIP